MRAYRHPPGLYVLFFTELWERYSFYSMMAILSLYMNESLHFSVAKVGQVYGASQVSALLSSTSWKDSLFVLTWDDWGGWYDHVIPPVVDSNGYGLRVPALFVSPYAHRGGIDSAGGRHRRGLRRQQRRNLVHRDAELRRQRVERAHGRADLARLDLRDRAGREVEPARELAQADALA